MDDQIIKNAERAAEQAEQESETARETPDAGSYTHVFKAPFTYDGITYEDMTFQFDALTGRDSLEIVRELRAVGVTVVSKPYIDEYVEAFAARACTLKDHNGRQKLRASAIEAMPYEDYAAIFSRTKTFLLRAEL